MNPLGLANPYGTSAVYSPYSPATTNSPYYPNIYSPFNQYGLNGNGDPVPEVKAPEKSMIAEWLANQQPYIQFSAPQAPINILGYNPGSLLSSIYTPASTSTAYTPTGISHGAGRFLGNNSLLGSPIIFTPSNTTSTTGTENS